MRLFSRNLEGWRKSGVMLAGVIWTLTLAIFVVLAVSAANSSPHAPVIQSHGYLPSQIYGFDNGDRSGGLQTTTVFEGDCSRATFISAALHVLINVVSTGVLASSNFFMQVLASPTRAEIDAAHRRGKWTDVGIPSLRNLRFVSWPKAGLWLVLSLSSVPLHLTFNSAVFSTDATSNGLGLLATESFARGGSWYLPGVGWGRIRWDPVWVISERNDRANSKLVNDEIAYIASKAASWPRLELAECRDVYASEEGLHGNRHLVVVVAKGSAGGPSARDGWTLPEVYAWKNASEERRIPKNDTVYTLWDASVCYAHSGDENSWVATRPQCARAYLDPVLGSVVWGPRSSSSGDGFNDTATLAVSHCLSEPLARCRVQVSNTIVLVVGLLALVKSIAVAAVLWRLWLTQPLVTLGDAVASFVERPDAATAGMCTFDGRDFARAKKGRWAARPRRWAGTTGTTGTGAGAGSRRSGKPARWGDAVPRLVWALTYSFCGAAFVAGAFLFAEAVESSSGWARTGFGNSPRNGRLNFGGGAAATQMMQTVSGAAVFANAPQLVLSTMYLLINALLTRMLGGREWAAMSAGYRPLRVSAPRGEQVSKYFLQMPAAWFVPFQAVGALLHWLMSTAVYLRVEERYHWSSVKETLEERIVGVGFSPKSILATLLVAAAALVVPGILARLRLPGDMTLARSCSAAVSAACHVQQDRELTKKEPGAAAVTEVGYSYHGGYHGLDGDGGGDLGVADGAGRTSGIALELVAGRDASRGSMAEDGLLQDEALRRKAQRRLRWGVVPGFGGETVEFDGVGVTAGHLAFGTEEEGVSAPVEGEWYG